VTALRALEAAARLGGFARAATALNVSASAVSHQIRGLEETLGVRLLKRSTGVSGVHVTPAGKRPLAATSSALVLIEDVFAEICGTSKLLAVSANVSLSTMWLARWLAEFSALHPETSVNTVIQKEEPDFLRHGIDLAVVHVPEGDLRAADAVLREEVFPVCSPARYPLASSLGVPGAKPLPPAAGGAREQPRGLPPAVTAWRSFSSPGCAPSPKDGALRIVIGWHSRITNALVG
jgi:LysR family glycine cleavage system transcriptional activator